jgi:UDP-perosamine 4-acetyltransferase
MKNEIIVVGAGGHAKVCIELLQAMGEHVAYCLGQEGGTKHCLGIPVLQGDDQLYPLREKGYWKVFIALGDNHLREFLATLAIDQGFQMVNAISPQAIISPSVRLGKGIAIMAGAVINAEVAIADLAIINTGTSVDHDCQIGYAAHLAPQCVLAGNVRVGNHSFLGVGCKVIPEIEIGEKATLGAGSVIISNIKRGVTAVGVPARVINLSEVEREHHG